jgi:hypothetical protein
MTIHVRSAGAQGAASVPSFLLRGPMHQHEIESLEFEKIRWPGASAVLLGGAVIAAVLVVALGTYLKFADDLSKLADGTHLEPPLVSVQNDAASAARAPMNSDVGEARTEAPVDEAIAAPVPEVDSHSPRVVRTERFEADPSVWADVRKFTALRPEEVPILDVAPAAQSPIASPAEPQSPSGVSTLHHEPARAHPHQRHRAHMHTRARRSRTQADGGAPSDVGSTRMTAEQLRQDGSKNPVVSTFSTILGPR